MSMTDPTDPNEAMPPAPIAPTITTKSGSGLAPDIKLPPRKAFATPQQVNTLPQEDILGGAPTDNQDALSRQMPRGFNIGYQGQQLVDKRGNITRGQYDPDKEAESELSRLGSSDRLYFQSALSSRGLYGKNGKPLGGTGFDSSDISVMKEFLRYANNKGLTVEAALPTFLSEQPAQVGGGGRTIRTTAKQDIRSIFQDTTQKLLGRTVSPDEIEKFVKAFEGMEIKEGMGGVRAPNIGVAAEQQVQQQFGPEAQAVGALGLFDILDKKIKGQA